MFITHGELKLFALLTLSLVVAAHNDNALLFTLKNECIITKSYWPQNECLYHSLYLEMLLSCILVCLLALVLMYFQIKYCLQTAPKV